MSLSEQFLHLSQVEFWAMLLFCGVAALAGFYFAFRWLGRARLIEDAPTAKIRSAHQGYVELVGNARLMDGEAIFAPLTGIDCCWYRYKIDKRGDKNWRTLESDTSDALFLLEDETGHCLVDPEGAEVTPSDRSVWYGSERYPLNRTPVRHRLQRTPLLKLLGVLNREIGYGRYRYTEERIYPGDRLYAIGLFKSLDELDHRQSQTELIRGLLQDWKRDRAQLLARFDLNRDGEIDAREWETARKAAQTQARMAQKEQQRHSLQHRLSAPDSRHQPFLLSTLAEFDLVRRYRLKAFVAIALFFITGSAAVWMLGLRLSQ
ncbi:GIDE domain-containing protein [Sedimenticola sp.]|uniref:GIDE domain-containing protein n=1 Tax=Sedimenticola sp. TaxID=1940285 RepID=UPI003D131ABE